MKIPMGSFTKLVLLIFIVSALFVLLRVAHKPEVRDTAIIRNFIGDIVMSCKGKQPVGEYISCFKHAIRIPVKQLGIREVTESLAGEFSQEAHEGSPGWVSCHDIGHMVGEIFVEEGGNVREGLAQCPQSCGFGCQHGVLFSAISKDPQFEERISSVCIQEEDGPPQQDDACIHGIGHAVSELVGRDIEKARLYCERFSDDHQKRTCFSGVLMEIVGFPTAGREHLATTESWEQFCQQFPQLYMDQCFIDAGANAYGIHRDMAAAGSVCMSVPVDLRGDCVSSLGNIVYYTVDGSKVDYLGYCSLFPDAHRSHCYRGYIESDVISHPDAELSKELCLGLPERDRRDCLRMFGAKISYVYGHQAKDDVCLRMDNEYESSCRGE